MKFLSDGRQYEVGIDTGSGKDYTVEERYSRPDAEYPQGSWLYKVGDTVQVATGYFALEYPDKPSPYWHGGPPFVLYETFDWPWKDKK